MKWFLQVILEIIAMVIAYLTNWLVVFFADEYGNLPHCLRWWQTYDNCLDVEWMITENKVPKIFQYDYKKHYIYHYEDKSNPDIVIPGYVEIIDSNFTIKEKIQRYFCRVAWLYRNSNYGFSYEVNGRTIDGTKNKVIISINEPYNEQWFSYVPSNLWSCTWSWFYCKKYCKWFRLRIYFGWKLKNVTDGISRHMLAFAFNPFKKV